MSASDASQSNFKEQVRETLEAILEDTGGIVLGVSARFTARAQSPEAFPIWQSGMDNLMRQAASQFAAHQNRLLSLLNPKATPAIEAMFDSVDQLRRAGIALVHDAGRFEATTEQVDTLWSAYIDVAFWCKGQFGRPMPKGIYELFLTTLEPAGRARDELLAANRPNGKRLSDEALRKIVPMIKPLTHATLTILARTDALHNYLRQLGVIYLDDQQ